MPRLFTALEIDEELSQALALYRGGLSGARWIEPEDYHLTLAFIGDVDERIAQDVHDALSRIRRAPVVVTLEGLGSFGGERPRSLIVRARADRALFDLQADHEAALRRAGVAPQARKFSPHVTLARLRACPPGAVAGWLDHRAWLASRSFVAHRFVLYSSRESVGGGPYVEEATYPLRGREETPAARPAISQ